MTQKKILITNRGYVPTSRGMCLTPITRPYKESTDVILRLLTRYNAEIEEVLDNGEHVKLTISNYATDNSVVSNPIIKESKPVVEATPVVEPEIVHTNVENNNTMKSMSRKERRRMEHEQRMAEQRASSNSTSQDTVLNTETKPENDSKPITEPTNTELDEVPVE